MQKPTPTGPITRASIKGLARVLEISLPTVKKYLRLPGAPTAPADGLYSVQRVREWIDKKKRGDSPTATAKEAKAQVDFELAKLELDRARRAVIPVAEIAETLVPLIAELDGLMEQEFEHTLPAKLRGKTTVEIQQMLAAARVRVVTRYREGSLPILPNGGTEYRR
jgi:hypothetical protein